MGFLANQSAEMGGFVDLLVEVGSLFTHEPYNAIAVVALGVLGYKITVKAINRLKQG